MYVNLFVGILGTLLTGTKTAFFMFIVAWLVMSVLVKAKDQQKSAAIKVGFSSVFKYIITIMVIFLIFNFLTFIQGRTLSDMSAVQVFSTYVGAPLKNLELIVSQGVHNTQIFGAQTFMDSYGWLYKLTKNPTFLIESQYRYNWINGLGIGNVYTQFMPLYYDFGLSGSTFVMFLLGSFAQCVYELAKFKRVSGTVNFWIIYYAYLCFAVIFSFFSNKFFEMIFSRSGIYFIVGLVIFKVILCSQPKEKRNGEEKYE